ncbi:hypothetical protein K2X05_05300 [bacterium]|nr:hypothetical protein [bacterium]
MSLTKANHNFGDLKKTLFTAGESPYSVWREAQEAEVVSAPAVQEVDVLELLRFNIDQLQDLNSRFGFLLEELSSVLVKKK